MSKASRSTLAFLALAWLAVGGPAQAAENPWTTITVAKLHCMSCAKKAAARLYKVPGVAQVHADVKKKVLTVTPRPQQSPSPRALWVAVEQAGYRPTRLEGPAGTFTAKPPN